MPWQECSKVEERMRFVARLLDGEKMAVLCREFDISRKTGYKIYQRYKDSGTKGFDDHETGRIECAENPFGAKVLPMSPV